MVHVSVSFHANLWKFNMKWKMKKMFIESRIVTFKYISWTVLPNGPRVFSFDIICWSRSRSRRPSPLIQVETVSTCFWGERLRQATHDQCPEFNFPSFLLSPKFRILFKYFYCYELLKFIIDHVSVLIFLILLIKGLFVSNLINLIE